MFAHFICFSGFDWQVCWTAHLRIWIQDGSRVAGRCSSVSQLNFTQQQWGILGTWGLKDSFANLQLKHNWFYTFKIHLGKRTPSKNCLDLAKCFPFICPWTPSCRSKNIEWSVYVSLHPQNSPLFKGRDRVFSFLYPSVQSSVLSTVGLQQIYFKQN